MQEIIRCIDKMFMTYLQSEQTNKMKRNWVLRVENDYNELLDCGQSSEEAIKTIKEKYGFYDDNDSSDFTSSKDEGNRTKVENRVKQIVKKETVIQETTIKEEVNEDIVYQILEEHSDVRFYFDRGEDSFQFVCKEQFVVFAVDRYGNCFGFIGGKGDLNDKYLPIGYVCQDGKCGRIANDMKEFLELVVYYPFWYEVDLDNRDLYYVVRDLEKRYVQQNPKYYINQKEIAATFGLNKKGESLDLLRENLRREPKFIVYTIDGGHKPYKSLV